MELTGQLLSSLSLLADSAPRTEELRTALEESFAMVHTMMDEYIQMTKDREEWWKAQLQQERAMHVVWEESLQTVAREGDVLERELRTRSRRAFVCQSYQKRHRRNASQLGEVLAKWDDAHDMRQLRCMLQSWIVCIRKNDRMIRNRRSMRAYVARTSDVFCIGIRL
jgi:hypothetical protein